MVKLDADPDGGIAFDPGFFVAWPRASDPTRSTFKGEIALRTPIATRDVASAPAGKTAMTETWPLLALAGLGPLPVLGLV
jgi:hypothetical protein